ncbi:anti-sigma factor family protein [Desulfitobacterium sp. Sab5]|uniref:anti-sigma factor family protein n=1 Tax=Desulfitobacterium nosdiversum TaxID=3375356 RepID=UPI003CF28B37
MECLQCMERISEYLDKELSESEHQDMQVHLDECKDCRNAMNELAHLREATKLSIDSIPVPPDLANKILFSIQEEKHKTSKNQWITGILLILFSSPLLLFLTRTFTSIFNLIYTTGAVFWRSLMTLITVVSPWFMLSLGILSAVGIIIGAIIILRLIRGFDLNEVLQ